MPGPHFQSCLAEAAGAKVIRKSSSAIVAAAPDESSASAQCGRGASDFAAAPVEPVAQRSLSENNDAPVEDDPGRSSFNLDLSGRTGGKSSKLLQFTENLFDASTDIQCGGSTYGYLNYVTGYATKESDSLQFKTKEYNDSSGSSTSEWRQTYRLLCKKAPLEPELAVEFGSLGMMLKSYLSDHIFAQIPRDPETPATNSSQDAYDVYLLRGNVKDELIRPNESFLEWLRRYAVSRADADSKPEARPRGARGRGAGKERTAVGVKFPFELLDIFLGAWVSTFVPHRLKTNELGKRYNEFCKDLTAPEGAQFLSMLRWNETLQKLADDKGYGRVTLYKDKRPIEVGDVVSYVIAEATADMCLRGLVEARRKTFSFRIRAADELLQAVGRNELGADEWSAKSWNRRPARNWSPQQAEALKIIREGRSIADANVDPMSRFLLITGEPGAGKTEVAIEAAVEAAEDGCNVQIAVPLGALISVYRDRLPPNLPITVETLHSSHRITRKADEQYVPPGRLRHFDLLEYDEGSQYEDRVWTCIRTALAELSPGPFVVIFGDWQQLQPVGSGCLLKNALDKQVAAGAIKHIDIKAHEAARCQDPEMHQFLCHARCHQPKKGVVEDFFRGRFLPKDVNGAARASKEIEEAVAARRGSPCEFTLLPTTNQGAAALNQARVRLELGSDYDRLMATDAVPADPTMGGGSIVICEGLRMRLSRNVDKDRSFVNGMFGTVVKKLSNSVFVLKTSNGVLILVHPIKDGDKVFLPCAYGYAVTIRRCQGSTLDLGCLFFDKRRPDRGYAYVGTSRFRMRDRVWHAGDVRRTDWLPVGEDPRGGEQIYPSVDSCSDSEDEQDQDAAEDSFAVFARDREVVAGSESECDDDEGAFGALLGEDPDHGWIEGGGDHDALFVV